MAIDPTNLPATARQTFSEDFTSFNVWNGTTGLDTRPGWAQWPQYDPGFTMSGNGEQEWFVQPNYAPTASANPFGVQNGVLTISAKPTDPAIAQYVGNQAYTSGFIDTYHEFSQTYGYFEMRAQLPAGQGLWPSFWLLPEDNSWPPELDAMEMLGNLPTTLVTTVHSQVSGASRHSSTHYTTSAGTSVANMTTGFHTYGVDWEPDTITWYFDGQKVFQTATPIDLNKPMYMIADLAVGGYWPGSPNAATQFPAQMQIDYIRAYQANPAAVTGTSSGLAVADNKTILPFTSVTLSDAGATTITATVTQSASANGILSDPYAAMDGGAFINGVYTVSGTLAQVQAALRGLVFTPTAHQVTPGSTVTTGFTIAFNDGHGGTPSDSSTSVTVTAADDAPVIAGTAGNQAVADYQAASPFAGVTVTDVDSGVNGITATISFAGSNGAFTAASLQAAGFTGQNGSYHTIGGFSAAALQAALRQLVFQPTADQVMPGQSVATSFTLTLDDQHGGVVTDSNTSLVATSRDLVDDFSGDAKSDILWQKDDGHVWQSLMNGGQVVGSNDLGNAGNPAWHVATTGDLNGDGKADLLWQNDDGHVWESQMKGSQIANSLDLGNAGDPAWHVVTTGDLFGTGTSDILWQNDDGHVWESQMANGKIVGSFDLGNAGNPAWHVVRTGDFNGDGKSDILWQNDDGHVWQSLMNGGQVIGSNDLGNAGNPAWHVARTGDFNGDGKSDILWQNDDGHVWQSLMNGGQVIGSNDLGNAGNPAWHVARTGDFNGDGNADIFWQNDNGHVWQSLMNGASFIGSDDLGHAGDPAWHVLAADG